MFKMEAAGTVISIVEAMLSRGTPDRALCVSLELHLGNRESGTQTVYLAMLFYRPKSYTLVATRSDHVGVSRWQGEEFTLKSYHDSAWRVDGVEGVFREMYDQLRGRFLKSKGLLIANARIPAIGSIEIHEVEKVDFDSTNYDKPVVVTWKDGTG